ncbi:hypothetical protein [Flavobacterium sp. 3HN19-14]|uniref:hypothetical protein n=1 Tax=Flavobacterium sp. 3HN19-14 TaxID=3448133 RepID=UPI003EDF2D70
MAQPQTRFWVKDYNATHTGISLMDANGNEVSTLQQFQLLPLSQQNLQPYDTNFRLIRSINRNMQMASMASITLMKNPLQGYATNIYSSFTANTNIVNASAIDYNDFWPSQCENGLPVPLETDINAYLYNILGNWKASKSYAYLSGRNGSVNTVTRKSGYFKTFNPFYVYNETDGVWVKDSLNWTYASQVTKFSPYGAELENRDALHRHSAAQYGYDYKLPVAVASNSRYDEMGFDGFEDYSVEELLLPQKRHFNLYKPGQGNITSNAAHTGKKSLVLYPGQYVQFLRTIVKCSGESDRKLTIYN